VAGEAHLVDGVDPEAELEAAPPLVGAGKQRVADTRLGVDVGKERSSAQLAPVSEHPAGGETGCGAVETVLGHWSPFEVEVEHRAPELEPGGRKPMHGAAERLVELGRCEALGADLDNVDPLAAAAVGRQELVADRQLVAGSTLKIIHETEAELERSRRGRGAGS